MKIKCLSWNILKGQNLDAILDLLKKEEADLIGLQEVIEDENGSQAKKIADELGLNFVYHTTFKTDRHTPSFNIGDAVLSKFPIQENRLIMLSTLAEYQKNAETEPRSATQVGVEINGRKLIFIVTHLAFSPGRLPASFRISQAKRLLEVLPKESLILCGDFNSQPDDPVIKLLGSKVINTDPDPTKPTKTDWRMQGHPQYRIDYIFVTPDLNHSNFKILDSDASDHKPIVMTVDLT